MNVTAYRIVSLTPESDAINYMDLYYPFSIYDFAIKFK
jgi:hypothetical protein